MQWHSLDYHGIFCKQIPVILGVHISMQMIQIFIIKQTECVASFFSIHSVKVLVHKIQSCFTNCTADFVDHSCVIQMKTQHFCYILWELCTHTCASCAKIFSGISPFTTNSVHFSSVSTGLLQVLSLCKMEPVVENLFMCLYIFFAMQNSHNWMFLFEFTMTLLVPIVVGISMYHTETCIATADESQRPQKLSNKHCRSQPARELHEHTVYHEPTTRK